MMEGVAADIRKERPALSVRDLSIDFRTSGNVVHAVKAVSWDVAPREILAIVGESGSGKSVSAFASLGLLPRNAEVKGHIELDGTDIIALPEAQLEKIRGSRIAMVFQDPMGSLNPTMTIGAQLSETILRHTNVSRDEARRQAIHLLEQVGLPQPELRYGLYPHQLSGGQRQRVVIAIAISCQPHVLIADEPTTALDVTVQAEILDLMRNLRDQLDSAVILITHDMGVVADLADRIAVMRRGVIVETGTSEQIFSSPQHPYTQELLAAVPHLGGPEIDLTAALASATGSEALVVDVTREALQEREAENARRLEVARREERAHELDAVAPILQLTDVAIEYPKQGRMPAFRAVEGANLVVRPGEVVGLVGESGSGKTTIGRAAVGLLPVAEGTLTVGDIDVSTTDRKTIARLRRKVGMVFQDPSSSLNPRLPIGESIGEPLYLAKIAKGAQLQHRIEELLDQVELPRDYRNRYPHELSGGQKQRVGIARALALSPELLVADEPTSALDVSVQAHVLDLLQELQERLQFACLFVTHDLAVVDLLADRIVVMQRGRIVEQGSRDAILRNPQDPYTQRLIAAVPLPNPEKQRERRELRALLVDHTS